MDNANSQNKFAFYCEAVWGSASERSILWHNGSVAVLINPYSNFPQIHRYLGDIGLKLGCILITQPLFEIAYRVADIKRATGAMFLGFSADLVPLSLLPRIAQARNICGVKIPHIDQFLDREAKLDLPGFAIDVINQDGVHFYHLGKLSAPPK